jgi:hypothetical protein
MESAAAPAFFRPGAGGAAIKGPGGRRKFDLRRVWQCPACGRRAYTGGQVVTLRCDCQARADPPRQIWMRLIAEPTPRRPRRPAAAPDEAPPAPPPEEPPPAD